MNNFTSIFHQIFILFIIAILSSCGGSNSSTPAPTPGTLQLSAASYSEVEGTDVVVKVSVTRTGGSDGDASVDYAVADGSADADDYSVKNIGGTLKWADGDETSKDIKIALINDASVELTEALTVSLSNASTATLGSNSSATVSIIDDDSIPVTGVVSAPDGSVSFNGPTYMDRMFAALFGRSVNASISDLVAPVPGVTVSVYEVDANGDLVSAVPITTATTDGHGSYTLAAPLDALVDPARKYIVRAKSTSGDFLNSQIIAANVNVDPVTDAVSDLVAFAATDLASMSVDEIAQIQHEVGDLLVDIDASSLTATQLSSALNTEALNNEEVANVVTSSVAAGTICGTVTDSNNDPLGEINIVVRDFGNWVTRAKTKTADDGSYCLNLPVADDIDAYTGATLSGEYILGAMNRTGDNTDPGLHASEWWSTGGMKYNRYDAEKISVTTATPAVLDMGFKLERGSRIRGTVTADGVGLEGVKVVIRDFENRTPLASARSNAAGNYRVNVFPGKYLVVARNKTIQPYASEIYDAGTGTNDRNEGMPVTASLGTSTPLDFTLAVGHQLSGIITDGTSVSGMRVMIDNVDGGSADRVRTNKLGEYRIWLRPGFYDLYAYGQRELGVDLTVGNQPINFSGTVKAVSALLQDDLGNPLSQVKFRLYDPVGPTYLGLEISNSDGTVTMHTDQPGIHVAEFKIDRASTIGGNIYNDKTQLALGNTIDVDVIDDLGTVTLPDGGILTGHVYAGNFGDTTTPPDTTTPIANFSIEVRDGGNDSINRFTRIRTRGDGSYVLTIQPGIYERVKMRDATDADLGRGNCNDINITLSATTTTTTVNYYDGDDTCEVNP